MNPEDLYIQQITALNVTAYRLIHDDEFKEEYSKDPEKALNDSGIKDEAVRAFVIISINTPDFILKESQHKTMVLADRFKESIKISLKQIESGYKYSMIMYWIAFMAGILLIIAAVFFAIMKEKSLLSIVFGSLGTMDLLVFFIMKPPLELQNSRIGFARLEAAFMSWFIDLSNLNGVFATMNAAYDLKTDTQTGQVSINKDDFEKYYEKFIKISDQSVRNTERTVQMMGTIIRESAGDTKQETKKEG